MLRSLALGFRALIRNWGLLLLVLSASLVLALLAEGLDDPCGSGFVSLDLELLLRGRQPLGLFAREAGPDPKLLGLAGLYLMLQAYLSGGLLGVFRAPGGGWTLRGLLHGCGFYFVRLLWLNVLALAAAAAAVAVGGSHPTLLALALLVVHAVSSYAKVIVVCEQRRSAVLACVSSLDFCARNLRAVAGQYLLLIAVGAALVALFGWAAAPLLASDGRTWVLALALVEALIAVRIALRLGLLAAQVALHGARGR